MTPRHLLVLVMKGLIRGYQVALSPYFGQGCRFHPTCSHYAMQAIDTHGPMAGAWLAARRLLRCHPWHPGGIDEVPTARPADASSTRAAGKGRVLVPDRWPAALRDRPHSDT